MRTKNLMQEAATLAKMLDNGEVMQDYTELERREKALSYNLNNDELSGKDKPNR